LRAQEADLNSSGKSYLLVEGIDDWHVHDHLRAEDFDIGWCGNDDQVLEKLGAVVVGSGTTKTILGAVLDADADTGVKARFQSICDRLQSAYDLPDAFPVEGLIIHPRQAHPSRDRLPIIGVWLMPDNVRDGILEDLLCIAMNSESQDYVAKVIDKAHVDGFAGFRGVDRTKVIVKTHITWQNPNVKNLGEAIGSDVHFKNLSSACDLFFKWQKRLFGNPSPAAQ
jgi:hypothetical protein